MKLTANQDRDAIGAWIEGGRRADCLCGLDIQLKLAAINHWYLCLQIEVISRDPPRGDASDIVVNQTLTAPYGG